ncbi:hypothetical protein BRADI_3g37693v3 [Brachypodium distachyon]|uniref:Uncharacterized protein n=1 Tax=Brachypodium distachyon TaxID=15368 RepID=A0A2K2D1S4_BRADI|nr:hypothetical protein BRADI_3g37693v3 [Brachypodium distachyon]
MRLFSSGCRFPEIKISGGAPVHAQISMQRFLNLAVLEEGEAFVLGMQHLGEEPGHMSESARQRRESSLNLFQGFRREQGGEEGLLRCTL